MIPECPRGQNCARRLDDEPELVNLTIPQLGKNNATISCGPRTRQVPIQIVRFLVTNPESGRSVYNGQCRSPRLPG